MSSISARWALVQGEWRPNVRLVLSGDRIRSIEPCQTPEHTLLVPGFVNAHSHVFQYAMRGLTQHLVPGHEDDDFWGWREQMYALAETLDPDAVYEIAVNAFREMLRVGYTSVGEFHYLHHRPDGSAYAPEHRIAGAIADAARATGMRLVLLPVAYHRGGFGRAASSRQRRFVFESADRFISYVESMRSALDGSGVSVGAGIHSIRAVPADWIRTIVQRAPADMVLHAHASEQRRELDECRTEHGDTPIRVLDGLGFLSPRTTLVHATHIDDDELDRIASSGATVCACPTTERDLGDGFLRGFDMLERGIPVCVGSDSHTYIEPRTELHLLEYHERLRAERRNVLVRPSAGRMRPSQTLMDWGTRCGGRSLGLDVGTLAEGTLADAVGFDSALPLVSEDDAWLALDRWLFSTPDRAIDAVYVAGQRAAT